MTEAILAGVVRELYATERWFDAASDVLAAAVQAGIEPQLIDDKAAKVLSDTVTPPGLVAVCDVLDVSLAVALERSPTLVAVAVSVTEPGNAGTIIRVADAAGADAVVFAGDSVDPHNGKSVRSSAGSLFHLPVVRERSIDAVMAALHTCGMNIVATAADGSVDLDDADALLSRPTAWLFGNEAHGLPAEVQEAADEKVRIPIHGRAESLNLATAAAICLYASARAQRTR